ncbi:hypothetical protein [Breoghania sp. JC706]|uniref:hypothetical protein n=1 Tax=Breoghania sp. JC706 TaxID=3117732 RepID=UPI00300B1880
MTWLKIILAALSLLRKFVGFLGDRQLLDAGAAEAIAAQLEASRDAANKAEAASDAAIARFDASGGVPDDSDPNLRD